MSVKRTLLDLVQDILSDLNSDEVNSIFDTEDSEQVAKIVKSTYYALMSKETWPHTFRALTLLARSDTDFPTHMTIKENLKELSTIYYDKSSLADPRIQYAEVKYCSTDDFLRRINRRDSSSPSVVTVVDDSGIKLLIQNDKHPEYFTSFDDENLIFDSYDSGVDATLQVSKFQAQGYIIPEFTMSDSFVPDLPAESFPLLYEEAVSRSQWKIRQLVDQKSEQEAGRQRRRQSRKSWTVGGGIVYPNYGRGRK